jgi:AcrR family transcriptional regulator
MQIDGPAPTRGPARERAILTATIALLAEVGYETLTMDAVAARAHASKTTIYRRWPGKPELVRAAVDRHLTGRMAVGADTGSVRGDLAALVDGLRTHLTDEFLALMSGLVHAMRRDAELAAALRTRLTGYDAGLEAIIGHAVRRGEIPADLAPEVAALAHEVIEAHVFRQMMLGAALDDAFVDHLVDDLIVPLLTHRIARSTDNPGRDLT